MVCSKCGGSEGGPLPLHRVARVPPGQHLGWEGGGDLGQGSSWRSLSNSVQDINCPEGSELLIDKRTELQKDKNRPDAGV